MLKNQQIFTFAWQLANYYLLLSLLFGDLSVNCTMLISMLKDIINSNIKCFIVLIYYVFGLNLI